jgi:hypothetical protein
MRSTKQGAARTAALLAVLLAAAVLAVSGCSAAQHNARDLRGPGTASADPADPDRVVAVRLRVSGGIAGVHEVYRVTRTETPPGMSAAEADRVLGLAGRLAARSEGDKATRMSGACCDRLLYDVTVEHADGSRDQVRFGGAKTPPAPLVRMAEMLAPAG